MTYPYCPDRQLDPEDTSLAELAAEQAEADAWEYLLHSGDQVPILDDYIEEDAGEAFELVKSYRAGDRDAMLEAARKMAVKLEGIMEGYIQ